MITNGIARARSNPRCSPTLSTMPTVTVTAMTWASPNNRRWSAARRNTDGGVRSSTATGPLGLARARSTPRIRRHSRLPRERATQPFTVNCQLRGEPRCHGQSTSARWAEALSSRKTRPDLDRTTPWRPGAPWLPAPWEPVRLRRCLQAWRRRATGSGRWPAQSTCRRGLRRRRPRRSCSRRRTACGRRGSGGRRPRRRRRLR